MSAPLSFRRDAAPPPERRVLWLGVSFLVVAIVLLLRPLWTPSAPPGQLVEVTGQVARPGVHAVDPPTLAAAVEAAGGLSDGVPETPLAPGDAVFVGVDGVRVVPAGNPLLVALPVDLNVNGADALTAIPGVTPTVAAAIVADRAARGPFHTVDDLDRVPGVGRTAVATIAPFVTTGAAAPSGPLDLNTADAAALERLPGIGPSLAARIVADRDAQGRYASVDALDRVSGIGPATLDRLRPHVTVGAP